MRGAPKENVHTHAVAIRERLRAAFAERKGMRGQNATQAALAIGRSKEYLTDFLQDGAARKESLKAAELAAIEEFLRMRPGSLLGGASEPLDRALATEAIVAVLEEMSELAHAGFSPEALKTGYIDPVARSIAALLGEGAAGIPGSREADSVRSHIRHVARGVWNARAPKMPS